LGRFGVTDRNLPTISFVAETCRSIAIISEVQRIGSGWNQLVTLQLHHRIPEFGTGCRWHNGDHFQQQIPDTHL
jgi:hypothetical protein